MNKFLSRKIRAQWRDMQVLFKEFRTSLLLFFFVVLGGALILFYFYRDPVTNTQLGYGQALYASFSLIFFQNEITFPNQWYLQILFFITPLLGLALVADGLIRFGVALTNKDTRGEKWQVAMASTYNSHIIVCGFGKVGYRVTQELIKFGKDVIAIEQNPNSRFVDRAKDMGVPLLIADARRTTTLLDANIKRADTIIPCTDNELTNLDVALDARDLNPDIKIVLRMFDPDLARRVEKGFGIHTAFSTSALTAPVFAAAAMRVDVKYSFYIGEDLLNISEIVIENGSKLVGWTVGKLESEIDLSVVYYQDGDITDMHPESERIINAGTKILVLASLDTLRNVQILNQKK